MAFVMSWTIARTHIPVECPFKRGEKSQGRLCSPQAGKDWFLPHGLQQHTHRCCTAVGVVSLPKGGKWRVLPSIAVTMTTIGCVMGDGNIWLSHYNLHQSTRKVYLWIWPWEYHWFELLMVWWLELGNIDLNWSSPAWSAMKTHAFVGFGKGQVFTKVAELEKAFSKSQGLPKERFVLMLFGEVLVGLLTNKMKYN